MPGHSCAVFCELLKNLSLTDRLGCTEYSVCIAALSYKHVPYLADQEITALIFLDNLSILWLN